MAVDLQYYDEFGNSFYLERDDEGFWVSNPDADISHFEAEFIANDSIDTGLMVQMDANIGDWFQIDNVKLYGHDNVDDSYSMFVRDYDDVESGDNPQLYHEISIFPNNISELLIPINEYITDTTFNTILGKIGENYQFLIDKSKFLSVPPNGASFRYGINTFQDYDGLGNVWTQLGSGHSQFWGYEPKLDADHVVGTQDAMIYSTNDILYASTTLSGAIPDVGTRDYYAYGDDKFIDIKSVEIDSNDFIWILDDTGTHGKVGIFSYDQHWRYNASWEVTTLGNPKHLITPTDLKIRDNKVFIACDSEAAGVEIRVFSESGSYLGVMSHGDLNNIESLAITSEYIIALFDNKLYRFDMDYNFVDIVDLFEQIVSYDYKGNGYEPATITKLANNNNGLFFYGIAKNLIYKFGQSGSVLESFGETAVNYINSSIGSISGDVYYDKDISDIYHDSKYNLYVSSEYDIIKYYDRSEVSNRLLDDLSFSIDDGMWNLEELDVDSDENTTAWVYNRVFDRILDNLNLYRLALKGSQSLISTNTFEKVVLDNFSTSNFIPLKYEKGQIAIGINELHCEGSLNRCIQQLQECFDICLGYINIKNTGVDPDSMNILSFELHSQTAPLPKSDTIDGIYYFDFDRTVTDFVFTWTDTVTYRNDPKLRAFITDSQSNEIILDWLPTPTMYVDSISYSGGVHTWVLTETYSSISESASVTIAWSKRLYSGTLPDSVLSIDGSDIADTDNLQWSSLNPILNGVLEIDVSNDNRYYIAVPATEWDNEDIKLYHPDYPEMEYDFTGVNRVTLSNPDFGFGNISEDYYVFIPEFSGVEPAYSPGITKIYFRLVRTAP